MQRLSAIWDWLLCHPGWQAVGAIVGIASLLVSIVNPIFAEVTDGEICGWNESPKTRAPAFEFTECRSDAHGVERYVNSRWIEQHSGYRQGGSQGGWCSELRTATEAAIGKTITWGPEESGQSRTSEAFNINVRYNYRCRMQAWWDPVYKVARSPACAREQPISFIERVAKRCTDPKKRIGWRILGIELTGWPWA